MDLVEIRPSKVNEDHSELTDMKALPIEKSASLVVEERIQPTPQVKKYDSYQNVHVEDVLGQSYDRTAKVSYEHGLMEERPSTPKLLIGCSPRGGQYVAPDEI